MTAACTRRLGHVMLGGCGITRACLMYEGVPQESVVAARFRLEVEGARTPDLGPPD